MIQEIHYGGLSANPSDYECPDGPLALSRNLLAEGPHLNPLFPPRRVPPSLEPTQDVLFIHEASGYFHYIVRDGASLYWADKNDTEVDTNQHKIAVLANVNADTSIRIAAVGNTLMVFINNSASDRIEYFLWSDTKYKPLGNQIPYPQLVFGLKGHPRFYSQSDNNGNTFKVTFEESIPEDELHSEWSEKNRAKITSQVMGRLNKFIAEQTVNKGRFCFPFFVRYALRLYDNSLVCHSAPILMLPSTTPAPVVLWERAQGSGGSFTKADMDIFMVAADLDYRLLDGVNIKNTLSKTWKDIIKSVDIFISKPIYTYDQNGECKSFSDTNNFDSTFVGRLACEGKCPNNESKEDYISNIWVYTLNGSDEASPEGVKAFFSSKYAEWNYGTIFALYNPRQSSAGTGPQFPGETVHLPEFEDDKMRESFTNTANFYLLKSIPVDDLDTSGSPADIHINEDYLQSLVNREAMTDDYLTHDRLAASYAHPYNSRINLAGVQRLPFKGFFLSNMSCLADSVCQATYKPPSKDSSGPGSIHLDSDSTGIRYHHIDVFIKEAGKTYAVNHTAILSTDMGLAPFMSAANDSVAVKGKSWGAFLFYPNTNAFKMVIRAMGDSENQPASFSVNLQPHDFLNGAYAFVGLNRRREPDATTSAIGGGATYGLIPTPNKVYTSEVNNPFFFPVAGINTVGAGQILGLSSATKALSQGQFGQFPLYAFTDEGVWALETNAKGTYSAKQPVTRDVCISPDSITQLDSSVLFATDRGVIRLAGSQAESISDAVFAPAAGVLPVTLPKLGLVAESDTISAPALTPDFLQESRMLYDYTHQRVYLYRPDRDYADYAYVFSLKTQQWALASSSLRSSLNSYPRALAVVEEDGARFIADFSADPDEYTSVLPQMLVTRPLKLGAPDTLKTIDTLIQRGVFAPGHVQTILYGSRDLLNWQLVRSSVDHRLAGFRGTPYKYFRIVALSALTPSESLFGASISFNPRYTNRLR